MEPKKIALTAVAALTFIMLAASCGGNAWISYEVETKGLWRDCFVIFCKSYQGYTCFYFLFVSIVNFFK